MSVKKRALLSELTIEKYAAEGKCIAYHNEMAIFVEGVIPGDVVNVQISRKRKNWAEAHVTELIKPSPDRIEPFCHHFGICGGCKWQMLPYPLQLQYKEQQVKDQLSRIGHVQVQKYLPAVGAEKYQYYRNKLEFTFSNRRYLTREEINSGTSFSQSVLGFHAPRLFDKVIDIEHCYLQDEPSNRIRNTLRTYAYEHELSFYDIREHKGLLRNCIIRNNKKGHLMVNLVFGEADHKQIEQLMTFLTGRFPEVVSWFYTINEKWNDSIYDLPVIHVAGADHLIENLENFAFRISPKSFFQTNSYQAEHLYCVVRQFSDMRPGDKLLDLYCGTGSIGLFLSEKAGTLIGVDTVADAIEDARINAGLNQVAQAQFFAGDVIKICNDSFFELHGKPDLVIIDPPRAGCHDQLIQKLLEIRAPRIVYVSCNPATQARDLQILSGSYEITLSQAVDMFPHTHHIENVVQLNLRAN